MSATEDEDRVSPVRTTIDLAAPGKRNGWLSVPHSSDLSAYGVIPVPITVIAGEEGPTLLLTAGNHGDEYEGPIILAELARELDPATLRGRVIIVSALNLPAFLAGTRTSPVDGGNLNRSFPGDPSGGLTSIIAFHVDCVLLPMADAAIDLHSGGRSLDYLPLVSTHIGRSDDVTRSSLDMLSAFGGPIGAIAPQHLGEKRTLGASAWRQGIPFLGSELGGGARVSRDGLDYGRAGIRRVLEHLGMLDIAHEYTNGPVQQIVTVPDQSYYCRASVDGIFAPIVRPGETISAGQEIGHLHRPHEPEFEPVACTCAVDGIVLCVRAMAATRTGDCLAQIGRPALPCEFPPLSNHIKESSHVSRTAG